MGAFSAFWRMFGWRAAKWNSGNRRRRLAIMSVGFGHYPCEPPQSARAAATSEWLFALGLSARRFSNRLGDVVKSVGPLRRSRIPNDIGPRPHLERRK
ncbi:hypothetical protein RGCCGE502_05469 [Rhizobium grahamii CCGE 502]|uniref:Uncharacterized protein n=1 Tax=Rhizobium grahamii CCGE 502 TaxID=990285 RepID=S3IKE3_9HYPH|nr:hypothetical protein RGCCGE502_05469 [Rhizobium grahamii CCGE 502]